MMLTSIVFQLDAASSPLAYFVILVRIATINFVLLVHESAMLRHINQEARDARVGLEISSTTSFTSRSFKSHLISKRFFFFFFFYPP